MATARRGKGEGSIFKRGSDLWVCELNLGQDQHGKRRRKTIYGKTKREVQEKLTKLHAETLSGHYVEPQRLTVAQFLDRWMADAVKQSVRQSTYRGYSSVIRNHINPEIGGLALAKVTPIHVQKLYASISLRRKFSDSKTISPRMRQLTHAVLNRALGQAVRWGLLSRNPCDAVDRPKVAKKAMKYLNPGEAKLLLEAATGDRLYALYVLAVTTGARQGELLALQWSDIDLKNGTLSISKTLLEHKGQFEVGEPKTAKGRRLVQLTELAKEALIQHKTLTVEEGSTVARLFYEEGGKPISKAYLRRRSFLPLLKKAGLPQIRFHDLRHSAATMLLSQSVHPKVVQELLGHSTINLTLDTYSHVLPTMQMEAAVKIDNLLKRAI